MTKRFTIRKIKINSCTRQGWIRKTHEEYAVYDREWKKNTEMGGRRYYYARNFEWKYIERANKKEVAQFWANWLNENCSEQFGEIPRLPMTIFQEGLKLYLN